MDSYVRITLLAADFDTWLDVWLDLMLDWSSHIQWT